MHERYVGLQNAEICGWLTSTPNRVLSAERQSTRVANDLAYLKAASMQLEAAVRIFASAAFRSMLTFRAVERESEPQGLETEGRLRPHEGT